MGYDQITVDRDGSVAWVTLSRPDRLNALTSTMSDELVAAFESFHEDNEVRCVVVTGEGRGFCAGQDLGEFEEAYRGGGRPDIERHLAETYHKLIPIIVETPKPVIAAVNGVAAGAGLSLAVACDVRIASDQARFTQAFVKIGLVPDSGGTFLLPRVVGPAKALELSLTGDLIDSEEALRIGLVSRVVPAGAFRDEVTSLAGRLAGMPTRAVAETKALFLQTHNLDLRQALSAEAKAQVVMSQTEDHLEGVTAFVEKREPKFVGR